VVCLHCFFQSVYFTLTSVYNDLIFSRYRNANRREYVPLQGDMGVFEAMELQRQTQRDSEKGTVYTKLFLQYVLPVILASVVCMLVILNLQCK